MKKDDKMRKVFALLRWDWQRRRGDFIRPRDVSRERWKAMDEGQRVACLMRRVRVGT